MQGVDFSLSNKYFKTGYVLQNFNTALYKILQSDILPNTLKDCLSNLNASDYPLSLTQSKQAFLKANNLTIYRTVLRYLRP